MSNKIETAPTKASGEYKEGYLHSEGGISVTVDGEKPVEVEKNEYWLAQKVIDNPKVYKFENKTNREILDAIFKDNNLTFLTSQASSGDIIICRNAVMDSTKHKLVEGNSKQIINLLQLEKGCNPIGDGKTAKKMKKGGKVKLTEEEIETLHKRWSKKRQRIEQLANNIQKLRYNVTEDLKSDDEKVYITALVVGIMLRTAERIGNDASAAQGHVGVTGFKKNQVTVIGNKIHLRYTGKSGVEHDKSFSDERLAKLLKKAIKNSNCKYVFCTSDGFRVKADRVNRYLSDFGITAKDIRGYMANRLIVDKLKAHDIPKEEKDRKKLFLLSLRSVADKVGHGAATLRKHYVVPELMNRYVEDGKILDLSDKKSFEDGGVLDGKIIETPSVDESVHAKADETNNLNNIENHEIRNDISGESQVGNGATSETGASNTGTIERANSETPLTEPTEMSGGGEITGYSVIDKVLEIASPKLDDMLAKKKEQAQRDGEIFNKRDEEYYRLDLSIDLIKALSKYIDKGDAIEDIDIGTTKGVISISARVIRNNKSHGFSTRMIIAEGDIQTRHYRYLVETSLPLISASTASDKLNDKVKKMKKEDRMLANIGEYKLFISKAEHGISEMEKQTIDDIWEESNYKDWKWNTGSSIKSQEEFDAYMANVKKEEYEHHLRIINSEKERIKSLNKSLKKEEDKLQALKEGKMENGGEMPSEEAINQVEGNKSNVCPCEHKHYCFRDKMHDGGEVMVDYDKEANTQILVLPNGKREPITDDEITCLLEELKKENKPNGYNLVLINYAIAQKSGKMMAGGRIIPKGIDDPYYYVGCFNNDSKKLVATARFNAEEIISEAYSAFVKKAAQKNCYVKEITKEVYANFSPSDDYKDDMANGGELNNDREELYKKWNKLVNMSRSELEKFYNSEEGKEAGLSKSEADDEGISYGRQSARWIIKMLDHSHKEWSSEEWKWAGKQVSFISRMKGMRGALYDENGNKTRKHLSLLIWGHNPEKKGDGGELGQNDASQYVIEYFKKNKLQRRTLDKKHPKFKEQMDGLKRGIDEGYFIVKENPINDEVYISATNKLTDMYKFENGGQLKTYREFEQELLDDYRQNHKWSTAPRGHVISSLYDDYVKEYYIKNPKPSEEQQLIDKEKARGFNVYQAYYKPKGESDWKKTGLHSMKDLTEKEALKSAQQNFIYNSGVKLQYPRQVKELYDWKVEKLEEGGEIDYQKELYNHLENQAKMGTMYALTSDGMKHLKKEEIKELGYWHKVGEERPKYGALPLHNKLKEFLAQVRHDETIVIYPDGKLTSDHVPLYTNGARTVDAIVIGDEMVWSKYAGTKGQELIDSHIKEGGYKMAKGGELTEAYGAAKNKQIALLNFKEQIQKGESMGVIQMYEDEAIRMGNTYKEIEQTRSDAKIQMAQGGSVNPIDNEIILRNIGNTIMGAQAHKIMFNKEVYNRIEQDIKSVDAGNSANKYFVYDTDGTLRAAQPTKSGALHYLTPERTLVYLEKYSNIEMADGGTVNDTKYYKIEHANGHTKFDADKKDEAYAFAHKVNGYLMAINNAGEQVWLEDYSGYMKKGGEVNKSIDDKLAEFSKTNAEFLKLRYESDYVHFKEIRKLEKERLQLLKDREDTDIIDTKILNEKMLMNKKHNESMKLLNDEQTRLLNEAAKEAESKETNEDMSKPQEIKGSVISSWAEVPETWKVVKKVSKVPYINSPYDKGLQNIISPYLGNDDLRPVMNGFVFDEHGIAATDAHKLLTLPSPNKKFKGIYCTIPSCKKVAGSAVGKDDKIDGKYPNYPSVFPEKNSHVYKIAVYKLKTFVRSIILGQYNNRATHQVVFTFAKKEDGYLDIGFNGEFLLEVLDSMLKLGYEHIFVGFSADNRAGIFTPSKPAAKKPKEHVGKEIMAMLMPVLVNNSNYSTSSGEWDYNKDGMPYAAMDLDWEKHFNVSYSFIDDEIYNSDGTKADFDFNLTVAANKDLTDGQEKMLKAYLPKAGKSIIPILEYTRIANDSIGAVLYATNLESELQMNLKNKKPDGIYRFVNNALDIDPAMSADEFPKPVRDIADNNFKQFGNINRIELLFHLEKAAPNIGKDELRTIMNGVHFVKNESTGNKLFIEATNAHTLYRHEIKNHTIESEAIKTDMDIVVSDVNKLLVFLKNITATNVMLWISGTNVTFMTGEAIVTHRLIDGKYPNVAGVIPKTTSKKLSLDITQLKECFKKLSSPEQKDDHSLTFVKKDDTTMDILLYKTDGYGNNAEQKLLNTICNIPYSYYEEEFTNNGNVFLGMPKMIKHEGAYFSLAPKILETFMDTTESDTLNLYFIESNRAILMADTDIEGSYEVINAPAPKEKRKASGKITKPVAKKDQHEAEVRSLQVLLGLLHKPDEKTIVEAEITRLSASV